MNNKQFKKLKLGDIVYNKETGKVLKFWQVHTPANPKHEPIVKIKSVFIGDIKKGIICIRLTKSAFLQQFNI